MNYTNIKRIILVGDSNVGKSCFVERLKTNNFEKNYFPTISVEVNDLDYLKYKLNIWDTAGQKKYQGIKEGYYFNTNCFILMFSLNSISTFNNVKHWYKEIRKICPNTPIILCGNKLDKKNQNINFNKNFENLNINSYFEISVAKKENLNKVLDKEIELIY